MDSYKSNYKIIHIGNENFPNVPFVFFQEKSY